MARDVRDVFVFPSIGTYNRIPVEPIEGGDVLSSRIKVVVARSDVDGEPFRIVFVEPKPPPRRTP